MTGLPPPFGALRTAALSLSKGPARLSSALAAAVLVAGCGALPRGASFGFLNDLEALDGSSRGRPLGEGPARRFAAAWSDDAVGGMVIGGCFLPAGKLWKESYGSAIPAVGLGVRGPLGRAGSGGKQVFYLAALALTGGHDEEMRVGATRITGTLSQLDLQGTVCLGFGPGGALFLGAGGNVAVVREEVATEGFDDSSRDTTGAGYHALAGCRLGRFIAGATYRSGFDPEGVGVFGGLSF